MADTDWIAQQKETFVRWVNSKTKRVDGGRQISSLGDLNDGIVLIQVMRDLFPDEPMPRYNKNPKLPAHKLDNLNVLFNFLVNANIRVTCNASHVMEQNEKMILGLLWTLILEFDINRAMKAAAAAMAMAGAKEAWSVKPGQAKQSLLLWVQQKVAPFGLNPQNFDSDFCDGKVFMGLVSALRPDVINYRSQASDDARKNLNEAFSTAEAQMNIPALLDVEPMLGGKPDDKAVMTYVINYLLYEQNNADLISGLSAQMEQANMIAEQERKAAELAALQRKQLEQQQLLAQQQLQQQQAALNAQKAQMEAQRQALAQQQQMLQQQHAAKLQQQQAQLEAQKAALAMQQAEYQRKIDAQKEAQRKAQEDYQRQLQLQEQQRQQALLRKQQLEQQQRKQQLLQQKMAQQKALQQQYNSQKALLQQQQEKLKVAQEVAKMKFFQTLQQQKQEGIGKRDYVLFVDRSGSMAGSRWREAEKAVASLAPTVTRACPQGISLYFFNDKCMRIDNITTADQVRQFFSKEKPDRGTNLSLALQHAFNVHWQTRAGSPETWLIVTDGAPNRPTRVWEVLKSELAKQTIQNEITISFIQIGSSSKAQDYLVKLRGSVPNVDTVTQDDLPKANFSTLFG